MPNKPLVSNLSQLKKITRGKIATMKFDTIEESLSLEKEKLLTRANPLDMNRIPTDNTKLIDLRNRLYSLFDSHLQRDYFTLEAVANIKADTFRKWLNGTRNIKRRGLAKFAIGLLLPLEIANELFALLEYPLYENSRFDAIIVSAINEKESIYIFDEELVKYGYPSIFDKE